VIEEKAIEKGDNELKETRNKAITGKKLLSLVLLVTTIALSLTTITAGNLNKHGATTAIECRKEAVSLRAAKLLSANWICYTNGSIESSPAIGDVDGDGAPEIVVGSDDGGVYYLNGTSGTIEWFYQTSGFVISSPIIADVDKDGHNEVIVGSNDNNVYCLNSTGQPKWNFTTGGAVISSPVIADIDGDGSLDIVVGSCDNKTYCLNCTSGLKWNYTTGGPVLSTPAIADIDGNGLLEVVVGSGDGNIYCLNGTTGTKLWNYTTGAPVDSSPAVADVDGDGQNETVIGSNDGNVYCLNKTGGLEWSYKTGGTVRSAPVITDVDNDSHMEVIVGSYDYNVYCLNETGGLKWNFTTGGIVSCSAAVTDFNGDNQKEVVVGTWAGEILCLNRTGTPICNCTIGNAYYSGNAILSSPAIADVNGDNKKEIVVGSEDHNIYCLSTSAGETGTLMIFVSDSSSGVGISGASVHSTSEPPGQSSLYNATAIDGSVTFRNILTGPYYFEVNKSGYENVSQYIYVSSNLTTTVQVSMMNRNPNVSSPIYIAIAGIAVMFLIVILVVRSAGGGIREAGDVRTYSYENTPEDESRSVVPEEPSERVLSPKICPHCGATYMRADASYCWNCGAGLAEESDTSATQGRKRMPLATVGRCMVCGLDVKEDESVVRCPFCGNIAHRTHMLEWLHTRAYCPECYHHLDERDLGSIH
jgi:outer membrane protein assembly factor BamB/predicted RNA-binding Zn-ribbon protein involved in translation (DUF1610 family)